MGARRFGVAVLGTGTMGRRLLTALRAHPRYRVVALWDPDTRALQAALADTPGARAARSQDDLIGDVEADLVYVASPPSAHRRAVLAVLQAGKACLCEKPLTHDIADAQALRDAVRASGLPFAVNFPFASAWACRRLRAIVHAGRLGRIENASIRLRFERWPRGWQAGASRWLAGPVEGGFTREVLSHFVFLSQRLFGPADVADVQLTRAPGQAETALRARLRHASVTLDIDAAVAGDLADDNRFEIVGDQGRAALNAWSQLEVDGKVVEADNQGPGTLDRLAAMLDGDRDHGLADVDEALAVVRSIETLLRG